VFQTPAQLLPLFARVEAALIEPFAAEMSTLETGHFLRITTLTAARCATYTVSKAQLGLKMTDLGIKDGSQVAEAASALRVSEFDLFRIAYQSWFGRSADESELQRDFRRFLQHSRTPIWVRDFARKVCALHNSGTLDPRQFGVDPTRSTSPMLKLVCAVSLAGMLTFLFLLVYLAQRAQSVEKLVCSLPPCY